MTYSKAKANGGASACGFLVLYWRDSRSLLLLRLPVLPAEVENGALRTCFCVARGRLEAALRMRRDIWEEDGDDDVKAVRFGRAKAVPKMREPLIMSVVLKFDVVDLESRAGMYQLIIGLGEE